MKLKNKILKSTLLFALSGFCVLLAPLALAEGIGAILDRSAGENFLSINNFITGALYLAGISLGGVGIFKIRDYMKDSDRTPLKLPLGLILTAVIAIALPSFLKTGVDTVFGQGQATLNSLEGSQLRR